MFSLPDKSWFRSITMWGLFLFGGVHGGLDVLQESGYAIDGYLETMNRAAEWLGEIMIVFGLRKAAVSKRIR